MPAMTLPPVPEPRSDLPPPEGRTPEQYKKRLRRLAESPVDAWRDQDGTIYLERMPASMAPAVGLVDSATAVPEGGPNYQWALDLVEPEYDFMEPTPVAPVPISDQEVPDATPAATS